MERAKALNSDNWLGYFVTLGKLLKHSGSIIILAFSRSSYNIWHIKGAQLWKHYYYHKCVLVIKKMISK